VEIAAPGHPLMARRDGAPVTWHLHGRFDPPGGAEVLVRDAEGRALASVNETGTAGRTVVIRRDPCYHHGAHVMPATTRFLAGFLRAPRALATGEAAWPASPPAGTAAR